MKKSITLIVSVIILMLSFAGCTQAKKPVEENLGVKSIADLNSFSEWFKDDSNKPVIIGIDPGAGIMKAAEKAIKDYGLNFTLKTSSEAAMIATMEAAIKNKQAVVITGWSPHWKFANEDWGLTFLEDPKGSFGLEERIDVYSRKDFSKDHPQINKFFSQISFTELQMSSLMNAVQASKAGADSDKIFAAVSTWAQNNKELINTWFDGVGNFSGEKITIAYVTWAEGLAMTHLAAQLLKDKGAEVSLNVADAAPVFTSLASGDSDIFMDAWLPNTHAAYLAVHGDKITKVGTVFNGAKIGLVVPSYVYNDPV